MRLVLGNAGLITGYGSFWAGLPYRLRGALKWVKITSGHCHRSRGFRILETYQQSSQNSGVFVEVVPGLLFKRMATTLRQTTCFDSANAKLFFFARAQMFSFLTQTNEQTGERTRPASEKVFEFHRRGARSASEQRPTVPNIR